MIYKEAGLAVAKVNCKEMPGSSLKWRHRIHLTPNAAAFELMNLQHG
jgi:hypothetical protein